VALAGLGELSRAGVFVDLSFLAEEKAELIARRKPLPMAALRSDEDAFLFGVANKLNRRRCQRRTELIRECTYEIEARLLLL
jgi:hypothetical protein